MLSEEQRLSYVDDGYLVVEDLLSKDEVDRFLEAQEGDVPESVRSLGLKRFSTRS